MTTFFSATRSGEQLQPEKPLEMPRGKPKIIAVVGPTASGKSTLAVELARKFGGEVISADSRQVYRGMDIGTGKVPISPVRPKRTAAKSSIPESRHGGISGISGYWQGIPHHLLDVASPSSNFTVAHYQRLARRAIKDILRRGKLPILCGGTGLYIDAALYNYALPNIPPNWKLRRTLEKKSAEALFDELRKLDPRRATGIDRHNKRRLVRALEIIRATGKPVPTLRQAQGKKSPYDFLKIGINQPREILKKKIRARIFEWLRRGLLVEVKKLHARGVSWQRLHDFGLTYDYTARHLRGLLTREEMVDQLSRAICRYAKRQMTWFKRDQRVIWAKNDKKALAAIAAFIL